MSKAIEWLRKTKKRPVLKLPAEPEEWAETLSRLDTPGKAAEVLPGVYMELAERCQRALQLPLHQVTRTHDWDPRHLRLWWLVPEEKRAFGLLLEHPQQ